MKQLVQNLKSGEMKLLDVPVPALKPRHVRVRVHYSLISAGTEAMKVSTARKGYIGKAKEKPEQVKQVLETLKREGIRQTYRKVMNKLDAWAPLGYSCAGVVTEVAPDVTEFKVGDRVACGGEMAGHSEVVSVPANLCAPVPNGVALKEAAFTTLGAIALQGVRQADLRIMETAVVIGLGLLGQVTLQILQAAGNVVFGIDIDPNMVEFAKKNGFSDVFVRSDPALEKYILGATGGNGVDAVIITAATSSLDPIELAGRLARKKGRVVVVGAVPTGFSRENYYKKELELRMSTSYGPGRYDPNYEEKGIDYPYGYIRWTENRNMQAFLSLLATQKIDIKDLITHIFKFQNAPLAYDLIMNKKELYLGILLEYDSEKSIEDKVLLRSNIKKALKIRIGFIGAGSFAQTYLLPNVKNFKDVEFVGVATSSGHTSRTVADKYNFAISTANYKDLIDTDDINTIFIATRHNLHGPQVLDAIRAGKHVFVEKPLAISLSEVEEIKNIYQGLIKSNLNSGEEVPILMVGFNRRFAPFVQKIKTAFSRMPIAIQYRINAGYIPPDHWIQDPEIGGGRIIGEVCHFVDLAIYLTGSKPESVSAFLMKDGSKLNDTLTIQLNFQNGSIASINYFANGNKEVPKEYMEVYGYGSTAILEDFRELTIWGNKKKHWKSVKWDKGHKQEIIEFLRAIRNGDGAPIPFEEIYWSSILPFKIIESIQTGKTVNL